MGWKATPSPQTAPQHKPKKQQLSASAATDLQWPGDEEWSTSNYSQYWWKQHYTPEQWAEWNKAKAYHHAQQLFSDGASPLSPATTVDPREVMADKQERVSTLKAMLASLEGKTDSAAIAHRSEISREKNTLQHEITLAKPITEQIAILSDVKTRRMAALEKIND